LDDVARVPNNEGDGAAILRNGNGEEQTWFIPYMRQ